MEDDEVLLQCSSCGSEVAEDDISETTYGDMICNDCLRICDRCEDTLSVNDDMHTVDMELWCQGCTEDHANYCDSCNEYTTDYCVYVEDRSESWCESCNDSQYCEDCDSYYADGCDNCNETRVIHDYSYRPDPVFYSTDKDERLFFGIEVEMEAPSHDYGVRNDAAEFAYRLDEQELAYLKSDGSLNCGMELVTHPMSHDYYQNEASELWNVMDSLRDVYNMKAWDTRTCGLHIHISRTGFSGGPHMHRFLNLVYSNQDFYEKLAGRSSSRWAKFDDVERGKWKPDPDTGMQDWVTYRSFKQKLDDGRNSDRYSAINTQNRATLEMRIFRGSVNKNVIKSQISLAHASVEYTRRLSVHDIQQGALRAENFALYILERNDLYPELNERMARLIPTTSLV